MNDDVSALLVDLETAILKFTANSEAGDMAEPLVEIARRYSTGTLLTALLKQTVLVMSMERKV